MGLDYGWTCPTIDSNIESFKAQLGDSLSDMMDECCPLASGENKSYFIKEWVEHIYNNSEDIFEETRSSNEDIRKEADNQIDKLESEISELTDEIEDKNSQIFELDEQLSRCEDY